MTAVRKGGGHSVEKVLRLFRQSTSALRALIVGIAANSHTCADRCVFCLGRAEAKNGFQKSAARTILFFNKLTATRKGGGFLMLIQK